MKEYECYLSVGSNLGDRAEYIRQAIEYVGASDKIQLKSVSSLYETPPWGNINQPSFLNGAFSLVSTISPQELLGLCQSVEQSLGRVRHEHWGPRTIDIDLLYIDGMRLNTPELVLPHPYMLERAFVLVPLVEIAPDLLIDGLSVKEHLNKLSDGDTVVLWR
ncbi:MAG: 2-amino-4-hydroxy-6-hydroxymethyldihydropteridine diphosphokinase [Anaerovibrio sp.]|uniref:2-amino-4-hydroxy-6- hydroxymethyldihydropteridine diphosphokinase n=1 Tax=Anaerovibrio sp. TaxID=1872532 RepID=UPI0025B80CFB|nr:2-amino-4-hydroxy-6-hydroxymethyldihydropteridine diphosphokinase [Anaerovibrio sp.]MBE6098695.1 2-amino-4-hydroxy-6-hydroxymethyldihydropteridine diphosphokinase [Anaerovibrio sp.]MBQ3853636.1 2-amino-4-hydroxy-6-hydroxymethyldihydropteridine diphosphokinase [Anaerovibrio sp.]